MDAVKDIDNATRDELNAAYRYCSGIVRQSAGNFYYAFLTLPKPERRGIHALYAFCRAGDDAADAEADVTGTVNRHGLVDRLRQRLDLIFALKYCDMLTLALADTNRRFGLDRKHFDDLLLGVESDIDFKCFETEEELLCYCYRVASTVGLLCLRIFGADTPETRSYAIELGKAMQLTNVLRDISEDYARGRVYLPVEHLRKYELEPATLFDLKNRSRLRELIHFEAGLARNFYVRAEQAMPQKFRRKLIAARAMGAIYSTILDRISLLEKFDKRIELSRKDKLSIVKEILLD